LLELRHAVPAIRLEKPSANQILAHAKLYIDELNHKSQELESEIEAITGRKSKATMAAEAAKANPPPSGSKAKAKTTKASKGADAAELDTLRRENTALRARLEELRRRAANRSPHRPFTPSQLHAFSSPRDSSTSPFPSSRPRKLSQSTLFPFSPVLAMALADHSSELESPRPLEHSQSGSPSRSVSPGSSRIDSPAESEFHYTLEKVCGFFQSFNLSKFSSPPNVDDPSHDVPSQPHDPPMVAGTETTFQANYRKRKSRA